MQRIVNSILFLTCIIWAQVKAQEKLNIDSKDSVIYHKLMQMDFSKYKDKTVDNFFDDLAHRYRKYIPVTKKPGYIDHVIFRYSDSLSVDIAVKNLGQNEPLNFNYKFKIEVFKAKKIDWICLRFAGQCIKGCEQETCN